MVDRVGKKILEVAGLTLILLSTLLPIFQVGLGAEEVNYVADDIYFVEGNGTTGINEIEVNESVDIGIVDENADDTGLTVSLPDGILLDQEGTKALNGSDQQIIYSEAINQVIITYGENSGRTNLSLLVDDSFEEGSVVSTVTRNDNDFSNSLTLISNRVSEIENEASESEENQESKVESEPVTTESSEDQTQINNDTDSGSKESTRIFDNFPDPVKVGDREGSDLTDNKIEYTIYQTVPDLDILDPQFELKLDLVDQINEVLIIDDMTVEVEGGGVSDDFIVTNVDNLVVAAAKPLSLLNPDFYGKTYALTIETHLDTEADWSPYYNPETQLIEIDNVGHALGLDLSELEVSLDSNVATGVIPVPEDPNFFVRKNVFDDDGNDITGRPGDVVYTGDLITYQIIVEIAGEHDEADTMIIEDRLQEGLEYVPGTTKMQGVSMDDSFWDGKNFKITEGVSSGINEIEITFVVKVIQEHGQFVENKASAGFEDPDNPGSSHDPRDSNIVSNPVEQRVEGVIEANKYARNENDEDITIIQPGEEFYYEIVVKNIGEENSILSNLTVTDTLPEGVEYVAGTTTLDNTPLIDGNVWSGTTLTVDLPDLEQNEQSIVKFKVKVTQQTSGNITNTAEVGNENPEVPIGVVLSELLASKRACDADGEDVTTVQPGEEFYYEIVISNDGDIGSILSGLTLTDVLPTGVEYVPGTTLQDDSLLADLGLWLENTLTLPILDLSFGEETVLKFKVKVTQEIAGTITNIAEVGGEAAEAVVDIVVPHLSAIKRACDADDKDITTVQPGEEFYYEIVVSNDGDIGSILSGLTLTDILPDGVEYVSGTTIVNDTPQVDLDIWSGATLTLPVLDLDFGDEVVIKFKVKVVQETSGTITNAANVGEENPEVTVDVVIPEQEASKKAYNEADEEITTVQPGEEFFYEIVVTNVGDEGSILKDVVVMDTLPQGVEYVAGTTTLNDMVQIDGDVWSGTTLTVELPDLETGDEGVVKFKVKVVQETSGTITNVANVGEDDPEVPVEVVLPELSATKKAYDSEDTEVTTVNTGDTIYYEIVVTNNTDESIFEDVLINDDLPTGVEYVAGSTKLNGMPLIDSDVWSGDHLSVNVGDLNGGEGSIVEFAVNVVTTDQIEITNIALVGPEDPENPDEPKDPLMPEATVMVVGARLETDKMATNENGEEINIAQPDDIIYYEIVVRNVGEVGSIAEDILVQDNLPTGLEYVSDTTTVNGSPVSDAVVWNTDDLSVEIEEIPVGEEYIVRFATKITKKDSGVIKNVAVITADIDSPDPENDVEIVNPKLESSKDVFDNNGDLIKEANHGDTVLYEIVAKNTGDDESVLKDVIMKDVFPKGIEYVSGTTEVNGELISDDVWSGNTLSYNAGDIESGEQVAIRFKAKITFTEEGVLRNIALIGEEDPDNPGEPKNPQEPTADLEVNKEMGIVATSRGGMLPFMGSGTYMLLTILGFVIVSLIIPTRKILKK